VKNVIFYVDFVGIHSKQLYNSNREIFKKQTAEKMED
jgi:hypothetical protein